jgi:recombination protein RecA
MLHMIASGEFGLVINDSIAAMLGEEEREKSMGEKTMGLQAKAIGAFLRKSAHMVRRYGATVVLINQWRDKIGVSFGDPRTSPGGRAPAFWDAIRLDVFGAKKTPWFDIGKTCVIKAMKNKVTGIDGVTCEYHIGQGVGLSSEVELTQRCIAAGFIQWPGGLGRPVAFKQSGKGDKKFTSMRTWLVYLRENPEVAAAVSRKCDAAGTTRLPTVGRGGGFGDDD